ncbi:DNA mismatch repair endonuclease MutL [Enterocloster clostridioformis]|uniref:DNA mismatch repair endonuclease MutL n=1 Tax=Enterocloster clostridioformis TaxID=1531 RepID=UPI00041F9F10|nr:DNA mismatch repair endonuclease MutL [Enterocloster clostridioformis]
MANITVLDQSTINKIAAGEVIERPASVVKELLENAIDAHATAVTVEIKDGGCSMIRVTDNGWGIPKEEIPLAFLRHATSKIKTVEDLFTISSLGFRGEALASIAAVAQVELITKTGDSLTGSRYQIEGGVEKGLEEIGAPEGTTLIARSLFYNTPARKKFLKTPMTEGAHVAALVEKIALSHPDISIRFIQNNQNKLYTSGNHNLKDLIYTVFGREIAGNLLPVEINEDWITVTGFTGKPVIARSNRNYENYFINGRYIKSTIISKAIEEAYKPYMMQHKYPFTMLHFHIEPDTLDVNVHPTKMELRFADGEKVYNAVLRAVSNALAHKELIPQVSLEARQEKEARQLAEKLAPRPEPFEVRRRENLSRKTAVSPDQVQHGGPSSGAGSVYAQSAPPRPSFVNELMPDWLKERRKEQENRLVSPAALNPLKGNRKTELPVREERMDTDTEKGAGTGNSDTPDTASAHAAAGTGGGAAEPEQLDLFDGKLLDPKARLKHKLIGQLFDTYWMVEYNEQLFIIDQHAAHEKVLYENTIKSLKTRQYDMQMVDPPIILTLNMNEELLLKKYMDYFTGIGFEIEPFGGREYAVRGVPANLFSIAKKELLTEMIDGLSEDMSVHNPDIIYEKVASMSCKAAVKGHHTMSFQEANVLIDQLLDLENPYSCPHGRPTIISMSKYELEKKFKRIV